MQSQWTGTCALATLFGNTVVMLCRYCTGSLCVCVWAGWLTHVIMWVYVHYCWLAMRHRFLKITVEGNVCFWTSFFFSVKVCYDLFMSTAYLLHDKIPRFPWIPHQIFTWWHFLLWELLWKVSWFKLKQTAFGFVFVIIYWWYQEEMKMKICVWHYCNAAFFLSFKII